MSFDLFPRSKKERNREIAERRKAKGDMNEDAFRDQQLMMGSSVTKRDQRKGGWDFTVQRHDILGRPVGSPKHVEVKSNHWNKESPRQLRQKATDRNYRRVNMNSDSIPGSNVLVDGRMLANRYKKVKWF